MNTLKESEVDHRMLYLYDKITSENTRGSRAYINIK